MATRRPQEPRPWCWSRALLLPGALAAGAAHTHQRPVAGPPQQILWATDTLEEGIISRTLRAKRYPPRDAAALDSLLRNPVSGATSNNAVLTAALDSLSRYRRMRTQEAYAAMRRNVELVQASVYLVDRLDEAGAIAVVSHRPSGRERDIIVLPAGATNAALAPAVSALVRLRHAPVRDSSVAVRMVVRRGAPAPRWGAMIVAQNQRDLARLVASPRLQVAGYGTVRRSTILVQP
ncbi:MAG TPA: hypothetical protein VG916_04445 [Gemmatimonadaceae bacterium]|nr:hypothetical protein [Gemmatimonadaceae bacterium]